jgi:hypothetical protein
MLRIKLKGTPKPVVIPTGHDTVRSQDGKTLQVIDKDRKPVDKAVYDVSTVVSVVRED